MATRETPATASTTAADDGGEQHPAATPMPVQPQTAEDVLAAQRKEYGQYVAAQPIYSGNALVYNTGDPVPASNVEHHGYLDGGLVVKTGSKAHEQLLKELAGQ